MSPARTRQLTVAASVLLLLGVTMTVGHSFGTFTTTATNSGDTFATATDYRAPTQNRSVIAKSAGGTPGFIKQGGAYFVYADLTDTGNPASGISTATSNNSSLTALATSTALASGAFSVGGLTYNRRSASQTATAVLTAGTYNYTVTSADVAGNSATQTYSVIVDNTAPTGSGIQTTNGGSIAGRPELNDTITYTFSEPIDPNSVLAGWTGAATNVVVRVNDGGLGSDQVQIFNSTNASQLPLGSVSLGRTDYTFLSITFGATGTASTMSISGNSITVKLGTQSAAGNTAAATGTMVWTPSATATDRAGNAETTTNVTESGTADADF
jgi:hypothetical protein